MQMSPVDQNRDLEFKSVRECVVCVCVCVCVCVFERESERERAYVFFFIGPPTEKKQFRFLDFTLLFTLSLKQSQSNEQSAT
jgi:hypothetical protein